MLGGLHARILTDMLGALGEQAREINVRKAMRTKWYEVPYPVQYG